MNGFYNDAKFCKVTSCVHFHWYSYLLQNGRAVILKVSLTLKTCDVNIKGMIKRVSLWARILVPMSANPARLQTHAAGKIKVRHLKPLRNVLAKVWSVFSIARPPSLLRPTLGGTSFTKKERNPSTVESLWDNTKRNWWLTYEYPFCSLGPTFL